MKVHVYMYENRGGATILKVRGTKRDSPAKRAKKNFFTPDIWKSGGTIFFLRGGTSNQITISIEYTEICYLAVALINMS